MFFVLLHAKLHEDFSQPEIDALEAKFIRGLASGLQGGISANFYKKIVLVNLAAEALASMQVEAATSTLEGEESSINRNSHVANNAKLHSRRLNLLSLNAKTFRTLLTIVQPDLERLIQEDDCAETDHKRMTDKLSSTLRRVLPSLRLYSSWLIYSLPTLNITFGMNSFFETTKASIQSLWQTVADTWTLLVNVFSLPELAKLPTIEYLLEEDEETLGFLPFQESSGALHRFHDMRTKLRKPGPSTDGIERHHPNLEMLGRVRDIVADGGRIAEDDVGLSSLHANCC